MPASSGGSSWSSRRSAKLAKTAIDYPPMQDPASFNLDAVKKQIDEAIKNKPGNSRTGNTTGGSQGPPKVDASRVDVVHHAGKKMRRGGTEG